MILVVTMNIFGIEWDMLDKSPSKVKLSSLNTVLAVGYPIAILFIHFLLSLLYVDTFVIYLTEGATSILLLTICFINVKKRFARAFLKMEAN